MPQSVREAMYERFLDERLQALRGNLEEVMYALTLEDRGKKSQAARRLSQTADDLSRALSEGDRPNWLSELAAKNAWYIDNVDRDPKAGRSLLATLFDVYPQIPKKWNLETMENQNAADFAAIYARHHAASRLPDLFNELVGNLETIIRSGKLELLSSLRTLERLVAILKKNARAEYLSTRGSRELARRWLTNAFLATLEKIPGVDVFVSATRETMKEIDSEVERVQEQTRTEILELTDTTIPLLESEPPEMLAVDGDHDGARPERSHADPPTDDS
jgi:hypothetical protein